MKPWLVYSLIAIAFWGIWGLFGKLATRSVSAQNLMLLGSIGGLIVFPLLLVIFGRHLKFAWRSSDFYYALAAGMVGTLGGIFFYWAIARGEVSRVVTVTAMYPVVTVILAWLFLKEPLTAQKIVGVIFAMIGIGLLAR